MFPITIGKSYVLTTRGDGTFGIEWHDSHWLIFRLSNNRCVYSTAGSDDAVTQIKNWFPDAIRIEQVA